MSCTTVVVRPWTLVSTEYGTGPVGFSPAKQTVHPPSSKRRDGAASRIVAWGGYGKREGAYNIPGAGGAGVMRGC